MTFTLLGFEPGDWQAIALSMRVSLIATALCIASGVPLGVWLARGVSRWRFVVDVLLMAPLVVPPVVTGFGLLVVLRAAGGSLLFTWWAAVLASWIVALPLMVRTVRASVEQTDPRLARLAATLGASPWRVFWTVTVPLAWPGIFGGAALSWARAFGEFGATIVVAGNIPQATRTVPLAIWTSLQSRPLGAIAGLVAASLVLSVGAVAVSERLVQRSKDHARHVRPEDP